MKRSNKKETMSKLIEQMLERENMLQAYKKVKANKGASGIDGIGMEEIHDYIVSNWTSIREQILSRKYRPQPVRRVEIPKPNGGIRKLGIPTVVDRIIEQAMVQVLTPICEPNFSESSYGFRPGRSCKDAIEKCLEYLNEGYEWIVDIDLEKFFDNVPQDKLMTLVHYMINDGDMESLIRRYLQAGVMENGKVIKTEQGTPQGGNLSPLLSNIMLNELDKELEARGLIFTRYADDCIILVRSEAAAKRVMYSITSWIERKLGLKVNATKTKITRPSKLKYLGFGFVKVGDKWQAKPHQDAIAKFVRKLKELTDRAWSIALTERITRINQVIRGWVNYFRIGRMKNNLERIDVNTRTRIRVIIWKQWKTRQRRLNGLLAIGVPRWKAEKLAGYGDHYAAIASKGLTVINNDLLRKRGLVSALEYYSN